MEQYIPKAPVVAEIDRWRDEIKEGISSIHLSGSDRAYATFEYEVLGNVKDFINTLEVKEVDFEKIWKEYFKYRGDVATVNVKHLAKHFFELGMQQSKNYNNNEE